MYKTLSESQTLPVSLEEVKSQLRLSGNDEDVLVIGYLKTAIRKVEELSARKLMTSEMVLAMDGFPKGIIRVKRCPVMEVSRISFVGPDGETNTLDPVRYQVDLISEPARIAPVGSWPSTKSRTLNAVQLFFKAGWESPEQIPYSLRAAILLLTAYYYENRDEHTKFIPQAAMDLINLETIKEYD